MKILLLDTGFSSIPIYNYLKSLSDEVFPVGNRETDYIAQVSKEKWIKGDYSDLSYIKKLISDNQFDFVVPGCTDVSIETFASLESSSESYKHGIFTLNSKTNFKDLCIKNKVNTPLPYKKEDFPIEGNFICKPVNSYSGNGVSIFNGKINEEVDRAINLALKHSSDYIIESYHEGQLFSYSVFIFNSEITNSFSVLESSAYEQYSVDTSYVIHNLEEEIEETLKGYSSSIIKELNLSDGLLHLQYILDNGKVVVLEATRRCPGDLYSLLIEKSTDFPYAEMYCRPFLNKSHRKVESKCRHILRHTLKINKLIPSFGFDLPSDLKLESMFKVPFRDSDHYIRDSILFFEVSTKNQLEHFTEALLSNEIFPSV